MWLGDGVTRISHVFLFQARGWFRLLLGSFQGPYHVTYHWHLKDGMPWSQPWHPPCQDSRPGNHRAGAWTPRLARPDSLLYSYPALALQIPPAAPCQLPSQQLAKTLSLQIKLYLWIFFWKVFYIYLVAFNYLDVVCWSSVKELRVP